MATIERRKNAVTGTITGLILQVSNLLIPFFIRSIFIRYIGAEFAGMDSLFKSILQVLNLAELGVGSALVFSMYKPIVEDDNVKICALLKLYKTYYRIIGIIILAVGLGIAPLLTYLIKGEIPESLNLYALYFLNLGATVISYWLFAYKNSILLAHQRTDVINLVTFSVSIVKYVLQIVIIIFLKNYYFYLIVNLLFQLLINCVIAYVSTRMFPSFKPVGYVDSNEKKDINRKVRDLFTAKVGGVIVNSADSIVISLFLGLIPLAIYNNYYYVLTAVNGLIGVFYNAIRAGIANELIVDKSEKKEKDFYMLSFISFLIISTCAPCFLNLYQPFMTLWVGSDLLLNTSSVYLFVVYFVVYQIPNLWLIYKDSAGVWRQDRFRPLISAFVNLGINILLVNYIGINGVLISTIVSYVFVSIPWLLINIKKQVINYNTTSYIVRLLLYVVTIIIACFASKILCDLINLSGVLQIIINFILSAMIGSSFFLIFFCWSKEFKDFIEICTSFVKRKKIRK